MCQKRQLVLNTNPEKVIVSNIGSDGVYRNRFGSLFRIQLHRFLLMISDRVFPPSHLMVMARMVEDKVRPPGYSYLETQTPVRNSIPQLYARSSHDELIY